MSRGALAALGALAMTAGCADLSAPEERPTLRQLEQHLEVPCGGRVDVNRESALPELSGEIPPRFGNLPSLTIEFYRDGQSTPFFTDIIPREQIANDTWFYSPAPEDVRIGVDRLRVEVASGERPIEDYNCLFALEPACPPQEVFTEDPRLSFVSQAPPGARITYNFIGPEIDANPQEVTVPPDGPNAGTWVLQPPGDLYVGEYDVSFTVRLDQKIETVCDFTIIVEPAPLKHTRCAATSPHAPTPTPLGALALSVTLGAALLRRRRT